MCVFEYVHMYLYVRMYVCKHGLIHHVVIEFAQVPACAAQPCTFLGVCTRSGWNSWYGIVLLFGWLVTLLSGTFVYLSIGRLID